MGNTIEIGMEDMAKMVNARWRELRKKNEWRFPKKEVEDEYKTIFILGYHSAWMDMQEISGGVMSLDELLGIHE